MNITHRYIIIFSTLVLSISYGYSYFNHSLIEYNFTYKQEQLASVIEQDKEKPIKLLFVGDIMLDRNVAKKAREQGLSSLFKDIKGIFKDKDLVIGNLEGTITNNKSISEYNHNILRFTFNPSYAKELKDIGFTTFSLANNHSGDFYSDGYEQTKNNLTEAQLQYFGSSRNDTDISTIVKQNDKNICFIGYHDLYTFDESPVINEIIRLRPSCDYIIIFAHWGDEYMTIHSNRQTLLAHSFIDSGADIVIGSHPHVVQPVEIYKEKAIFYSLGNFIFDQDFSYNTQHGLAIEINLYKDRTEFELLPTTVIKSSVSLSGEDDINKMLNIVKNKSFTIYK